MFERRPQATSRERARRAYRRWMPLMLGALVAGCAIEPGGAASAEAVVLASVTASVETTPVPHSGDAADDPCIYVDPTDPARSTVIGTDKLGGIAVYDLSGRQLQYRADGKINNIDLRYGFPLAGAPVALVGGTNRSNRTLIFWQVNADRTLSRVGAVAVSSAIADVYGFTMYRSAITGSYYAFVVDKVSGVVEQYRLDGSSGQVTGTRVRTFDNGGISEGMVADDARGTLFVSEETVGVWKYGAEPSAGSSRTNIAPVGTNGLTADLEGLTIYQSANNGGYLLISSQGSSNYVALDRAAPHAYRGTFKIANGSVDGTADTDGIDVMSASLGAAFPEGVFVAQDGLNDSGNQNFKLVPWGRIARAFSPALTIDASWNPRTVPAPVADNAATGGTDAGTGSTDAGTGSTDAGTGAGSSSSTTTTVIARSASWRYLDNGTDQGTAWRGVSFVDTAWKSGGAELGYGDGDETTVVGYGPDRASKYTTTYFRRAFSVTSPSSYTALTLRLKRDDGAVVYLNGTEVYRTNMPTGAVTYATRASLAIDDETYYQTSLPTNLLLAGTNVLAIEIHQATGDSSDISMVAELSATVQGSSSCTPTTCAAQGKNCGSISDGCGGTLPCGTCTSPQTCGGGGSANVCGGGSTTSPVPLGVSGSWTLVFSDEFNGSSLDTTKWAPHWFSEGGTMNNVGTYASNVAVTGGNLVLTLASSSSGAAVNTQSNNGFSVQVGMYAEARVYFAGNGTSLYNWPAWWLSGPSWPAAGEHDIAEVLGGNLTVNYHSPSGAHNQGSPAGYWGGAFHVYGIYRKASSADVYWDGRLVRSYPTDDNGAGEQLIFNVGATHSGPAAYGAASQMKVDYVRVWR